MVRFERGRWQRRGAHPKLSFDFPSSGKLQPKSGYSDSAPRLTIPLSSGGFYDSKFPISFSVNVLSVVSSCDVCTFPREAELVRCGGARHRLEVTRKPVALQYLLLSWPGM